MEPGETNAKWIHNFFRSIISWIQFLFLKLISCREDIKNIFKASRDPEELKHYWIEVYDKAGTVSKNEYEKYVWLINKVAKANSELTNRQPKLNSLGNLSFRLQLNDWVLAEFVRRSDIWETIADSCRRLDGYVRTISRLRSIQIE